MRPTKLGFIGLGNMGRPMATNIVKAGFELTVYDKAGTTARAPAGSTVCASTGEVAERANTVFLSLPDGAASVAAAKQIAAVSHRATTVVIDLSTVGIATAREAHRILADAGVGYMDAPVSGGRSGAEAAAITVMWGGPGTVLENHRPVLDALARHTFRVGDKPGQGQAMKLLNNFLSATAMAATSESMVFGRSQGLDLETMLAVVNASSGRNTATSDKFVNRILTGTYDSGFHTALMAKDMRLYLDSARAAGTRSAIAESVAETWRRTHAAMPESDFTRVHDFVQGGIED